MICDEMTSHKYVLTAPRKSQTMFRKTFHTKTTLYFWYKSLMLTVVCVWEKVSPTTTLSEEIA